tara:strand:- start:116 stop:382 length:267 start_codon:yes stop_codon:yes gene_type:complete
MKEFLVNIWAYDHHAKFSVLSQDNPASLEQAILDKLGEKSIVWEKTGMFGPLNRITYEEVINGTDDATLKRPLHKEEGSGPTVGARTS